MNIKNPSRVLDEISQEHVPQDVNLMPGILARTEKRNRRIMKPKARLFGAILLVLLLLAFAFASVPGAAALALRLLGYIPGFGVVQTSGLRILAEPVVLSRDGVTFTLESVVADSTHTSVSYKIEGITPPQEDTADSSNTCTGEPYLQIPGGKALYSSSGGGVEIHNGFEESGSYPALPEDIQDVVLVMPCLYHNMPLNTLLENWEIPFHLVQSPGISTVVPIVDIKTPEAAGTPTPSGETAKKSAAQDISLDIESMAEVEDGFILLGNVKSNSPQFDILPFFTGYDSFRLTDSTGIEIPIEEAPGQGDQNQGEVRQHNVSWAFKVLGKSFQGPLTLSLNSSSIALNLPVSFEFDPGEKPHIGQEWNLDRELPVLGYSVHVDSARYISHEDGNFGLEFTLRAAAELLGLSMAREDDGGHSSPVGGRREGQGDIQAGITTDTEITGPVKINIVQLEVAGPWTAVWNPPVVEGAPSPTPTPKACLTKDIWDSVQLGPVPVIPPGIGGKIVTPRNNEASGFDLFLSGLDGSDERKLGPGPGSLSRDSKRFVYIDENTNLNIMEVDTGATTKLTRDGQNYHPIWSPDGRWIAFIHQGDGQEVAIIAPDGSGRRRIGPTTAIFDILDWSPDSSAVLVLAIDDNLEEGFALQSVNISDDTIRPVLPGVAAQGTAAYSPDGKWIVYQEREFGRKLTWMYVAHPDGSEHRLVSGMDNRWSVDYPTWSPDGKWLSVLVSDYSTQNGASINVLIQLDSCQIIPLPQLKKQISSWLP
jgi:hypothetical protein